MTSANLFIFVKFGSEHTDYIYNTAQGLDFRLGQCQLKTDMNIDLTCKGRRISVRARLDVERKSCKSSSVKDGRYHRPRSQSN